MRIIPRRAETELEDPFRTPEQLALAMPLIALIGLMLVVSAVVAGGSGRVVALVAVGALGLCAIAPTALIEVYVTRPLRKALAQVRAARDGRASEGGFTSGVVADLVHLARDIQAAQANLVAHDDTVERCERMVAAGDKAVRAFRLQTEELREAADQRDDPHDRSVRADIAELVEAVKSLCDAPAAGLDGAVERLEAMLVYIAETLERIEARDNQIEGGVGRVEKGVADLARLVAREAEAVRGVVSDGGPSARRDLAAAVVEEKVARERVLERIDTMEARLAAKLNEAPAPDAIAIAQAIHVDAEADRRALREDAASGQLEAVARLAEGLSPGAVVEALRVELGAVAQAVSQLAEGSTARALAEPGAIVEALRSELSRVAEAFVRLDGVRRADPDAAERAAECLAQFEDIVAERLRTHGEDYARRLDAVESRVVDRIVAIGRDNEAATLAALTRAARQITEAANWLDSTGARHAGTHLGEQAWERLAADVQGIAKIVEALAAPVTQRPAADETHALAQTQAASLCALEERFVAPALMEARDLAARIEDAMGRGDLSIVKAVAENTARLDALARLQDERLEGLEAQLKQGRPAVEVPKWRSGAPLDDLGVSLRPAAVQAKSAGAVVKLVVSMADALDFRFSHIEAALEHLVTSDLRRDDVLDAGFVALASQLQWASQSLKAGLSDFASASAALAEEVARSNDAVASAKALPAARKF